MLTAAQVLAENNFGNTRTGGLAGPMGLFLIVLLAIATVLLIRNMNGRLRRLPEQFPHQAADGSGDQSSSVDVSVDTVLDPTTGHQMTQEPAGKSSEAAHQGRNPNSGA